MTFQPGQSGNPNGRPHGSRNKTTLAVEALLDGEAESITRKAIELAKSGNGPALRLCLDRIAPARKDQLVVFDMPQLKTAADAVNAASAIVSAVPSGELTPGEALEIAKAVNVFTQAVSNADIEQRLEKLEQTLKVKR
jgi:hypothetical protein